MHRGAGCILHTWPELALGTGEKEKTLENQELQAVSAGSVDIVSCFTTFRRGFAFRAVNDNG